VTRDKMLLETRGWVWVTVERRERDTNLMQKKGETSNILGK
jgi:hypothetical protein